MAAGKIYAVIDRESAIDALTEEGLCPPTIVGDIEFKDVRFAYRSRPDREILKGVSFTVKNGETLVRCVLITADRQSSAMFDVYFFVFCFLVAGVGG